MRINGFEQIKGFYSWVFSNQDKNIRSTHISLYMFLVNQNNRNSWVEWFKCPYDLAMGGSGVSNKKTYYSTLKDLQDWDLIDYRKGINNYKAPLIRLEVLYDTSTVPQSEPQLLQQSLPLPLPLRTPQLYKNIKLLTNNLELITLNINKVIKFLKNDDSNDTEKKNRLFSFSKWNDYETVKSYLLENKDYIAKYKGADLKYYIEAVNDWSDQSNTKRNERGWIATIRNFMNRDIKGKGLIKISTGRKPAMTL